MWHISAPMQVNGSPVDLLPEIPAYAWIVTAVAVAAVIVIVLLAWRLHRARRQPPEPSQAGQGADTLTKVAAAIATIVAGQGMWQFLDRIIGDVHWSLRALMFAFLEISVVTSAVRARRSMRENYSAGIDGIAVWVLTSTSAVLAALEARSLAEALFRLAAPLVAAWLWERGMAIERRRIRGRSAINWRLTPERVAVALGLAEAKNRTADQVDTERRLAQVALAAKRARELRETGASERRQRAALKRLDRVFAAAEEHVGLASDDAKQQIVKAKVAALYSATHLLDVEAASAWARSAEAEQARSEAADLAAELRRWTDAEESKRDQETLAALATMAAAATGQHLWPVTPGMTPPVTPRHVIPDVTAAVTDPVNETTLFVPPGWSGDAPTVTAAMTPADVITDVNADVTFDITDPSVFDLPWPPSQSAAMTPVLTPAVTSGSVTTPITMESKAEVMRAFWERERAQGRYPRVVDLAREAGADTAQASRIRAELVEALPWRERRKATPRREKAPA